jgi:hypothetical protein
MHIPAQKCPQRRTESGTDLISVADRAVLCGREAVRHTGNIKWHANRQPELTHCLISYVTSKPILSIMKTEREREKEEKVGEVVRDRLNNRLNE